MTRPTVYLLDTNTCIYTMNQHPRKVGERVEATTEAGHLIGISSITQHELWFGAYRSGRVAFNTRRVTDLVGTLELYEFDNAAANCSGEIRAALAATGTPIGPYDLLIAGHALSLNAVLVTNNVREFSRVPSLKYEDWTI